MFTPFTSISRSGGYTPRQPALDGAYEREQATEPLRKTINDYVYSPMPPPEHVRRLNVIYCVNIRVQTRHASGR